MRKITLAVLLFATLLVGACTPKAQPTAAPTQEPSVEQVAGKTPEKDSLTGTTWMWIGFTDPTQQFNVESPKNYALAFNEDATVSIKADCNNAGGSYTADGGSLKIEIGPMTKAMCSPESRSDDFIKYLGAASNDFFEDGLLYIDLMADGGTMTFAPSDVVMADDGQGAMSGSLTTNPWQWVSFVSPAEEVQIEDPANYMLTFMPDGTVAIKADCNNASGSYTTDGKSLEIEVGPTTLAMCPPGSKSEDFLKYLGSSAIYFFEGSDLYIDLMADGGTMRFSK